MWTSLLELKTSQISRNRRVAPRVLQNKGRKAKSGATRKDAEATKSPHVDVSFRAMQYKKSRATILTLDRNSMNAREEKELMKGQAASLSQLQFYRSSQASEHEMRPDSRDFLRVPTCHSSVEPDSGSGVTAPRGGAGGCLCIAFTAKTSLESPLVAVQSIPTVALGPKLHRDTISLESPLVAVQLNPTVALGSETPTRLRAKTS
ncbi:uncharacterized protein EI90DRAFT_3285719 [Cantharellus anzutake]|uniref:uncharacterized protein n=1 Tax=Cantharellus anzutake TaxID=1750568 RepID=UPI001908AFCF|nr:uncharacterized protein EI90DRAFT_3285719 [Cantharellus anzutake]KAF8340257.1 hypothetical protein EI90DRAFT_3285719 [Cantharellus anzutake]